MEATKPQIVSDFLRIHSALLVFQLDQTKVCAVVHPLFTFCLWFKQFVHCGLFSRLTTKMA